MPIVNVKGVANQMQFPDDMDINDIRTFLQKKFTQRAVGGQSDALSPQDNIAAPYKPSLMERAGQGVADVLSNTGIISNRYGAQQIGKNVAAIGEMLPGIGDVAAVDDFSRAAASGDNLGMGLAALGVIPVAGDVAKKGIKGARKYYHGGSLDVPDRQSGGLVFAAEDINQAKAYAGENGGVIKEFDIADTDVIDEDEAIEVMKSLNIKPLDEAWDLDEVSIYEALDPEFEQFIGNDNITKLKDELGKKGKSAISFYDQDILTGGTGRQTAKNLVMLNNKQSIAPKQAAQTLAQALGVLPAGDITGKAGKKARKLVDDVASSIKPADAKARDTLKSKYPDLKIGVSETADNIILDKVIVPDKSKGTGTKFMNDLIADADSKGKSIGLTPSSDFGGNKKRLTEFYKRFGFVENKGKNKDFTISESMIRPVKPTN